MTGQHRPDCSCHGCDRKRANAVIREEVEWLRSFHWDDQAICERLGITPDHLRNSLYRRTGDRSQR